MKKYHDVKNIRFVKHQLRLRIDGKNYRVDLRRVSKKLATANEQTKMTFEISPSGYGIHWPEIDEDLSIDAMIKPAGIRKVG
jgi:hypothetical protein